MAEVAVSRLMFRDILMLIARLRAPPAPGVRGARIECDKQRRQGCAITKAKEQVLCARRREPIDSAARGTHRWLGLFAMDAQKPDNGARLSRASGKNVFQSVNCLTLLERFLIDAA
jgi:hypothetical protein